ncbi:MAG: hypothetical protein CL943_02260 [Candidatus Diapherotrites archaeon]|uniref:RmlD-like substrate binding domain-containing protein n=1 Tax=Candidatus Iainarchaeum sp. TaxID=3101447 RepID=A0A2D6M114_9ARCH|nr:hypothetical protein [Candidatus Diapherotrites archaeon]|tara:strand:+ start:2305 stop:3165 length:861 start_codon:yes stop_codon:yes gene_type:complete
MNTEYLILGNGFMGNKFHNFLENTIISDRKIHSARDIEEEIVRYNPRIVINCIGNTGKVNIDWCETHKPETFIGNVSVPLLILEACNKVGVKMVHLGTGCIYQGDNNGKGYSEDDKPNFEGSYYSRSKLTIEKMLKEFDVLQLRLRMPFDDFPSDKNLINKLIGYEHIINIPNSITYIPDFLEAAKTLLENNATGIYNVVNKGAITHSEILELYKEIVDSNIDYEIISLEELYKITKAERSNCILSTEKLEKECKVRDVREALEICLPKYKKELEKALLSTKQPKV